MEPWRGRAYFVEIGAKASEDFAALDPEALELVHKALDELETNPRPAGARHRKAPSHYGLRVGACRILYAVSDESRLITLQRIRYGALRGPHRRD
jgi:mRNA-degrading endonuclease RelE of RelBE toxin-antitoxin system